MGREPKGRICLFRWSGLSHISVGRCRRRRRCFTDHHHCERLLSYIRGCSCISCTCHRLRPTQPPTQLNRLRLRDHPQVLVLSSCPYCSRVFLSVDVQLLWRSLPSPRLPRLPPAMESPSSGHAYIHADVFLCVCCTDDTCWMPLDTRR